MQENIWCWLIRGQFGQRVGKGWLSSLTVAAALGLAVLPVTALAANVAAYTQMQIPLPMVSYVSPHNGSATGGTQVDIVGTGLLNVTGVNFGSTPASSFTLGSDTAMTATAPTGSGTVDITVNSPYGWSAVTSSDQFAFEAVQTVPTVSGVSPNSGPVVGGTTVTINGSGFTGATEVDFGSGNKATNLQVVSNTTINAMSPQGSFDWGPDVTVTTAWGTSTAHPPYDQFNYAGPVITSLSPASGPTVGGTQVTINGSGFTGLKEADFGMNNKATNLQVVNDSTIIATTPIGIGTVYVTLINQFGEGPSNSAASQFTYSR